MVNGGVLRPADQFARIPTGQRFGSGVGKDRQAIAVNAINALSGRLKDQLAGFSLSAGGVRLGFCHNQRGNRTHQLTGRHVAVGPQPGSCRGARGGRAQGCRAEPLPGPSTLLCCIHETCIGSGAEGFNEVEVTFSRTRPCNRTVSTRVAAAHRVPRSLHRHARATLFARQRIFFVACYTAWPAVYSCPVHLRCAPEMSSKEQ